MHEAMKNGNKVGMREQVPGKVSERTGHGPNLTGMHGRMLSVADHRPFRVIRRLLLFNIIEPWVLTS